METAQKCQECGLPIPAGDAGNHCPNCLLRLAFLPDDDDVKATSESSALPSERPRYFAGYELVSEIAFGGMGVVWKARQLGVNRLVALKMIPAGHLALPQMRLRFRIEIETVVQLDHPNIVPLYETGEHEGQHYFSMKLLEGGNLGEWIACRQRDRAGTGTTAPAQLREAMRLLITIARAVHHAHQRGILHRDLKPSNILLDQQGEPHVADFGLAKVLGRDSGITITESALGSPNYMSPEQASGHPTQLTVAADVYGLGAILYELLTGQPPFQAATPVETMRRVVDDEATSPRQLNPAIDADLETICLKCLQKQPGRRYESADALAADLQRWLAGQPIEARPVGPTEQFTRWCRRQPALATALGLSLALLLLVVVGTVIAGVRIARADRKATAHLRESLLGQARVLRLNTVIGRRDEGLDLIHKAAALDGPPEYRRELRHELLALLARTEVNFVSQPHLAGSPDPMLNLLAPRGNRFATVTNLNRVRILNPADRHELARFGTGESPVRLLEGFSPDGRYLALRHANGFGIWDTDTGNLCYSNRLSPLFSFDPSGSIVIIQTARKVAAYYELPSMRVIREVSPYAGQEITTTWAALSPSPDGRWLAAIRRNSRAVELIDLTNNRATNLINEGRAVVVKWSPDSACLAVGTTARRVMVWEPASHRRIYTSNVLPGMPQRLALNVQHSLLAAGCEDGMLRFLDFLSPQPILEVPGEFSVTLSFNDEGTRLQPLFRNGTAGYLQLQPPRAYYETVVASTEASAAGCAFSADGRIVAVGTLTNVAFCTALEGTVLTNTTWNINSVCFDPHEPAILVEGTRGLYRWSLPPRPTPEAVFAGVKQVLRGAGWRSFAYSQEGHFVAANVANNAAYGFDRHITNHLFTIGPHAGVEFTTVSPDGRWVVTGSEVDRQLRIWNTQEKREELSLPGGMRPKAAFSPDGKWLATSGIGFELRETGNWRPVSVFRDQARAPVLGAGAFSPDGRMLAVVTDLRAIHLIDLPTLETLAVLRPPGATEIQAVRFSPDGTRLAAVGDAVRLRVWNLPALREQLAEFKLDWQTPPPNQAEARR